MPILEWLNKNEAINTASKVPYRILKANKDLSYGEKNENMIIKGDNLEALKALLPYYKGQVKCIYIDPPYNTGNAFEHYDDNLEHSKWLSIIYPRLEILRELLREDGTIWIQIDDDEFHYLKVICDEVFGRNNFINTLSVNMKNIAGASGGGEDKRIKKNVEFVLIYAKNYQQITPFKPTYKYSPIYQLVEQYRNENKSWKYTSALVNPGDKIYVASTLDGDGNEIKIYERQNYEILSVNALMQKYNLSEREIYNKYAKYFFQTAMPQSSIRPRVKEKMEEIGINSDLYSIEYVPKTGRNKGKIYEQFYKGRNFRLFAWLKDVAEEINGDLYKKDLQGTYWDVVGETKNLTKEGNVEFPNGKKPEYLLSRIFKMATEENDLVLDSFLGSGTTCAVAQKMGRKYIGIEMGEHAITHCAPRMKAVIDGEQGGISKSVNWHGGGGYTFYDLGETVFDGDGNINKNVDFKTLASHIWFSETKTPLLDFEKSPLLGIYNGVAYYLLYNGILGDKKPDGGNVLTQKIFDTLPKFDGKKVIYGEATRMNDDKRNLNNITFKQTPYDIKAR